MTESDLVRRAQSGNAEAFAALMRTHQGGVYGLCLRHAGSREDALDLTSETFLRAYRSLGGFDPALPLRPWLLRIATNLCRDLARRRTRDPVPVAHEDLEGLPDEGSPPVARLLDADDRAAVRQAVQELPDPYRTLVLLHFFNRLSYREISETLQIPIGTVGTQIHRAKRLLREKMILREVVSP